MNFSTSPDQSIANAQASAPALARVEAHASLWPALAAWRELESFHGASAYQSRGFVLPWYEWISSTICAVPLVLVGYDAQDRPAALMALAVERRGPFRLAMFAGGKHSNFGLPLLRPGVVLTIEDARAMMAAAARSPARPDVFVLLNQPKVWAGVDNPFAALSTAPSPSDAYGATFGPDAEAFLKRVDSKDTRKKLRSKEGKLAALGPLTYERAATADRARTILTAFVEQKTLRFALKHKDPGFARVAVRGFLDALATGHGGGDPTLDLYALSVGDRIVATYGGLPWARRWHGLVNSFDPSPEFARSSPAELLLRFIIRDLATRGIESFDLGIGESRYKSAITTDRFELCDCVIAVSALGRVGAVAERSRLAAKRWIKHRPWALSLVEQMRIGPV